MLKGDIVLVTFPFSDLVGSKNRPAIVLLDDSRDSTLIFITSNIQFQTIYDILLKPNESNRLKVSSLIKINKIATLENSLIKGKIGALDSDTLKKLDKKIVEVFSISV